MKIRKILPGVIINCPWCKAEGNKVSAIWHLTGANKQACVNHRAKLEELKAEEDKSSGDYSEADHQTWLRL